MTDNHILKKLLHFCHYRERTIKEIRERLSKMGINSLLEQEPYIQYLQETELISEKRFIQQYIQGKIHLKKWGPLKIQQEISKYGISDSMVSSFLSERKKDFEYHCSLLIEKKTKGKKKLTVKDYLKLLHYLYGKGYPRIMAEATLKKFLGNESGFEE